jgi:hypothetical protein
MVKIDVKNNKDLNEELSYRFPESERITIDKANLQIQLDKFKSAVLDTFSLDSFINLVVTVLAVWVPLFTSDFKSIIGISPINIKGAYVGFASLITVYVIYRYIIKPIDYLLTKNIVSNNSEKMTQIILDKCNKK